jgi:hypothetical protein
LTNFKPITESSLRLNLKAVWLKAQPFTKLKAHYPLIRYGTLWYIDVTQTPLLPNATLQLDSIPVLSLASRLGSFKVETAKIGSNSSSSLLQVENSIAEIKAKVQAEIIKLNLPNSIATIRLSSTTTSLN